MSQLDSLLSSFSLFEQKNQVDPVVEMGLSSLKKGINKTIMINESTKPISAKRIARFSDIVRSLKINKVPYGRGGLVSISSPSQYFITQYNDLCNEIAESIAEKSFYVLQEENEITNGLNVELPQCVFPPTIMGSLTEMLNDISHITHDNILSIYGKNQFLSLAIQFVLGLGIELQQNQRMETFEQSQILQLTMSVINEPLDKNICGIHSSIKFLQMLFVDLLFGEGDIDYIRKITKLNDLADQLLIQMGMTNFQDNSMLKKRCNAVIYLLIRGGLKTDLLNYLEKMDQSYLPTEMFNSLRSYISSNGHLNEKQRRDVIKFIPQYEATKDYFAILLCNLMANVDIIGRYHEIDSIIKQSLDDYIWYNLVLNQSNPQKISEFENNVSKIIDSKYFYLFCVVHHFEDAITFILNEQTNDYQNVSAALLIASLCIHYDLIKPSTAKTFDLILKKPLIESDGTFNFNKFIYQFIETYNPPYNTVITLIKLLGVPNDKEAAIKIIMELGRSDLMNSEQISSNPEVIDYISRNAYLEKPEVAMMVNSMVGNLNEYLRIVNEKAAVMLNDKIGRNNLPNELSVVTESVLSKVTDNIIKNDFFIILRIYGIYNSCANSALGETLAQMSDLGIFPMKFDEIDSCVIKIQSLQSKILRKILNGVYYEVISLFSDYIYEFSRSTTIYIDQNIPVLKEIIKSSFVVINFLPQYFIQQQFAGLMNSNRTLLI